MPTPFLPDDEDNNSDNTHDVINTNWIAIPEEFEQNCNTLREFIVFRQKFPSNNSENKKERKLYAFISRQRQRQQQNKLDPAREALLNSINRGILAYHRGFVDDKLMVIDEDLEDYTKCCVCLEPYEEGPASAGKPRLPIKSATCAHSLCEGCLDDYHASLVNGRSTLRYVRCPQCNDKSKKAFDIQNKVVDFFLREYIQWIKELQSTIAQQQVEQEIASLRIQCLNGLDAGIDEDLENYTKCCVCLEPYEEGPTSTENKRRLPIKSATCAHSLCEECLDDYHASLMNGRSTLRYVRCPQCSDKTKKAFDIQNKVVDVFLREYIQCRKRKRSA